MIQYTGRVHAMFSKRSSVKGGTGVQHIVQVLEIYFLCCPTEVKKSSVIRVEIEKETHARNVPVVYNLLFWTKCLMRKNALNQLLEMQKHFS
ncbi:unnamed protein product [Prunus armeniaca]